jgi:hypothetical protein
MCLEQRLAQRALVQFLDGIAVRVHALVGLDDLAIQLFGQLDVTCEQVGPVLIGDAQGIAKAPGNHQQSGLALAFQEGVGGHGGSHFYGVYLRMGYWLKRAHAQASAYPLQSCIRVVFRVAGKQFQGIQGSVRPSRHQVGEGAAAVYPELPFVVAAHELFPAR